MQRAYISGRMSGLENFGYPAFDAEAKRLRSLGYTVYCPTERFAGDTTLPYETYMRAHLSALLDQDIVVRLPRWSESPGAILEVNMARTCGIKVCDAGTLTEPLHHAMTVPLLGITGCAGSGKTTLALYMERRYSYQHYALADAVRDEVWGMVEDIFPDKEKFLAYVEEHKREELSHNSAWTRQLLQAWASYRRDCCGEDYWLKQVPLRKNIILSDVRYPDEVRAIHDAGGLVWRLERPGCGGDGHASEVQVRTLPVDAVLDNTAGIPALFELATALLDKHLSVTTTAILADTA